MTLKRHIRQVFNLHPTPHWKGAESVVGSLAHLGYPQLFQQNIFFNANQRTSWYKNRNLNLPSCCCVCGKASTIGLPCFQNSRWWSKYKLILADVPHCEAHATGNKARLIALTIVMDQQVAGLRIIAHSRTFLEQAGYLSRKGEPPPPWVVFPSYPRDSSGWRQGDGEFWWNEIWKPFWDSLSISQRDTYFTHFPPPEDWKDLR